MQANNGAGGGPTAESAVRTDFNDGTKALRVDFDAEQDQNGPHSGPYGHNVRGQVSHGDTCPVEFTGGRRGRRGPWAGQPGLYWPLALAGLELLADGHVKRAAGLFVVARRDHLLINIERAVRHGEIGGQIRVGDAQV